MRIDSVNGHELRDIIDWRWEADGDGAELEVLDPEDDQVYAAELYRERARTGASSSPTCSSTASVPA